MNKIDAAAIPDHMRDNYRLAECDEPDRYYWKRWGNWALEVSPTMPDWVFLVWAGPSNGFQYWIDCRRFHERWLDHLAMKTWTTDEDIDNLSAALIELQGLYPRK